MKIIAVDLGPVHTGFVVATSNGEILREAETSGDGLILFLVDFFRAEGEGENVTVVIEDVTPRRTSFPGMWSATIAIAKLIGKVQLLCELAEVPLVMQNPSVVRGLKKRLGRQPKHTEEARAHLHAYLLSCK